MGEDLLKPASRLQEIHAGVWVLGAGLFLGYFGVRGTIMYLHGSRAAPADPVACAVGIFAGFLGGFFGLRLLTGWRDDQALMPTFFLFIGGAASLAGGLWFTLINRSLHGSVIDDVRFGYWWGLFGVTALVLGWRRLRKRTPVSGGMPPN